MYADQRSDIELTSIEITQTPYYHQIQILAIFRNELPKYLKEFLTPNVTLKRDDKIDLENYISTELTFFLNNKANQTGYLFQFQAFGPDIIVRQIGVGVHGLTLFYIEAKRLPPTKNQDYVQNGIRRFKIENHAKDHNLAAMLGYVQENDFEYWFTKINKWIDDCIADVTIIPEWLIQDKLEKSKTSYLGEYESLHTRKTKEPIKIHHFWLNFCIN